MPTYIYITLNLLCFNNCSSLEILQDPRVFSFLHVPVQAGSDAVLLSMRREYTAAEFCQVADYLLARVPDMTLATDIICQ